MSKIAAIQFILTTIISFSVPVIFFVLIKKKFSAELFPVIEGSFSYIVISWIRAIAREIVITESLKNSPWMYYFVYALLSGVFEEFGKYFVFVKVIPDYERVGDCLSYALGHCAAEIILTHEFFDIDFFDAFMNAYSFLFSIIFSCASTLLVYISVHLTDDKRYLTGAVIAHTLIDFIRAFYYLGVFDVGGLFVSDIILCTVFLYLSYRIYRHVSDNLY